MKILKIAFKNINSLQGTHEIDFEKEPFQSNSLFAITGPTGSGKTTLLDVIVLALFNEVPRLERVSKSEIEGKGAILTRGQKEAYARVTYSCAKGKYTSEWSISTARTGNLRDYDMQLSEAISDNILVQKKSEVPSKNEELIGLKYDQFVKSVLLAQGAFAEFLQVAKKERSAILEKITGMHIYRQLGIKTYDKYRTVRNTVEDLNKEIQSWQNELRPTEEIAKLKQDEKTLTAALQEMKAQQELLKRQVEHKNKINVEVDNLKDWEKQEEQNSKALDNFESEAGRKLTQHKSIEPIQQKLVEWNRLHKDKNQLKLDLAKVQENLTVVQNDAKKFNENIEAFLHQKVSADQVETQLADFEKQVLDLQNKLHSKSEEGKALKNEIEAILRPLNLQVTKPYATTLLNIKSLNQKAEAFFEQNKLEVERSVKGFDKAVSELQNFKSSLQKAKMDAQELQHNHQLILKAEKEIIELKESIKALPERIKVTSNEHLIAEKELSILELELSNQKLMASLEQHRSSLADGEPCPLCGAIEHPYAEGFPTKDKNILEDKIHKQRSYTQQLAGTLRELQTTLELKIKDQEKILEEVNQLQANQKIRKEKFKETYSYSLATEWDAEVQKVDDELELYKRASKELQIKDVTQLAIPKLESMLELFDQAVILKDELREKYNGDMPITDKVADYEKQWRQLQSTQQDLYNRKELYLKEKDEIVETLKPLEIDITDYLKQTDFDDIMQAFNAILDYDELQKLQKQKENLVQTKNEIHINKKAVIKLINELKAEDSDLLAQDLHLELNKIQSSLSETEQTFKKNHHLLLRQEEFLHKISDLKKKVDSVNQSSRHWKILNDLIGDATGNKFNTFAQDLTLQQLLQLANKRLEMLSERYMVANPMKDEDESLVVIDKDMGGMRRSVKTLSGGETFVISLALALALSDLASKNVQIESLFIDEGFGTLDPDTLDQTLNALEQLQEEGSKMIGIISHVASLKERITTQIQVLPNGRGFSTLEIVG